MYFWSKTEKVNIFILFSIFELFSIPSFILNRQFDFFFGKICIKMMEKTLLIVRNPRILKLFIYHQIHFHSLKITCIEQREVIFEAIYCWNSKGRKLNGQTRIGKINIYMYENRYCKRLMSMDSEEVDFLYKQSQNSSKIEPNRGRFYKVSFLKILFSYLQRYDQIKYTFGMVC